MDDTVLTLAVLGGGGLCAGWWMARQTAARQRRLALVTAALVAAPFGALVFAGVLKSDTLGWLAGLTLMIGLMVAVPVLIGLAIGWVISRLFRPSRPAGSPTPVTGTPVPAEPSPVATPLVPQRSRAETRGLLFAMAGVAAGFVFVIGLGFRLHGQRAPWLLEWGVWPAAAVLLALSLPAVRWTARQLRNFSARRGNEARARAWRAERQRWIEQLKADPRRLPYVARIAQGEWWTPERVAYDLDPDALACCAHLQPVERALRRAGVPVLPIGDRAVRAPCVIDPARLAERVTLGTTVRYSEPVQQDRQGDDDPVALLHCAHCGSSLWAMHPARAPAGAMHFPQPSNI